MGTMRCLVGLGLFCLSSLRTVSGFLPTGGNPGGPMRQHCLRVQDCLSNINNQHLQHRRPSFVPATGRRPGTAIYIFDKMFEEEGPLGKGITVGKVQVALAASDRSSSSIFAILERKAQDGGDSPRALSSLANEVCLALLRKSDEWIGACSTSKWFKGDDYGMAESFFNDLANREASKFEKEYLPGSDSEEKGGGPTIVVVSLVIEIQGDSTKFDGAGFSISGTKDVLSSIASDVTVEFGECLNAAEVFWTPSERDEVLTRTDMFVDFPELIDI